MRLRMIALLLLAGVIGLSLTEPTRNVQGCAPAPQKGSRVDIATETATIIWDSTTKTQHFIRTASFSSTSAEFGFLVPTPTKPELSEANSEGYQLLEKVTAPRVVVETRTQPIGCGGALMPMATADKNAAMAPSGVQVLETKRVGIFDAAVLKAEDAESLYRWLADNGYDARPELKGWLKNYTDNKWIVTAFKIAANGNVPDAKVGAPRPLNVHGSVVRMSFQTEKPFFPYREPEDQRSMAIGGLPMNRMLRVYFVSDARFEGQLGDGSSSWPGRTIWSNRIEREQFTSVATSGKLPEAAISSLSAKDWWLTEFEDRSSPRPGTDEVYFVRSPDQSAVERPPIVHIEYREWPLVVATLAMCLMPLLVIAGIGIVIWRLVRRKGAK